MHMVGGRHLDRDEMYAAGCAELGRWRVVGQEYTGLGSEQAAKELKNLCGLEGCGIKRISCKPRTPGG